MADSKVVKFEWVPSDRTDITVNWRRTGWRPINESTITMTANTKQIGGLHYQSKVIQPWDYIAVNNLGYFEGNVVKYVSRWREKGGVEDLRKAQHYLQKLIELQVSEDIVIK